MATSHWKSALRGAEEKESPYLAAYDFFDQAGKAVSRTLTIKSFAAEVLTVAGGKKEKKLIVHFDQGKGLVWNMTKGRVTEKLHGSNINNWIGKQISLTAGRTLVAGEEVDCILVMPYVVPVATKKAAEAPAAAPVAAAVAK